MDEKDAREVAEVLVVAGLRQLVSIGRVGLDDVNCKWHVEFSDSKLESRGLAGAATFDKEKQPVLYLRSRLSLDEMLATIAHEVIHLAQICKGDLIPMYGFQIWKGTEYVSLPADSPDYFEAQPWEKEAKELEPLLLEHLRSFL